MENIPNIEERIMDKIKNEKIKLRSRYVFLAEKLGLGSALILSIILAVLFFSLALFYLRSSDNLSYLSFGSRGFLAFLDSFPFGLIAVFAFSVILAAIILKKVDMVYKQSFGRVAILLIMSITLVGTVLAFTRLAERIEQETFDARSPGRFFRPFMERSFGERRGGLVGRVVETGEGYVIVQTPRNLQKIDITKLEKLPNSPIVPTSWIMTVGEKTAEGFLASMIRVMAEDEMPMIQRGVHRRFGSPPPGAPTGNRMPCAGFINSTTDDACFVRPIQP